MSLIEILKSCFRPREASYTLQPAMVIPAARVKCADCRHFDRTEQPDRFYCSNLRLCRRTGVKRWAGDNAEQCPAFDFYDWRLR